jgi:hypothetical protein
MILEEATGEILKADGIVLGQVVQEGQGSGQLIDSVGIDGHGGWAVIRGGDDENVFVVGRRRGYLGLGPIARVGEGGSASAVEEVEGADESIKTGVFWVSVN